MLLGLHASILYVNMILFALGNLSL